MSTSTNTNPAKKTRIPKPKSTKSVSHHVPLPLNPLAKAMEKKPQQAVSSQPESWYDEEVDSVSHRQQHQTQTEHEKRKLELFAQLKKTEEELLSMHSLLEQREKLMKEHEEQSNTPVPDEGNSDSEMQQGGESGEGKGADTKEKFTKKSMRSMRERMQEVKAKLQKMNRETDIYLCDTENTMQYLDSLEAASQRLGPLSEDTRRMFGEVSDEDIIAEIYKENQQPGLDTDKGDDQRETSPEELEPLPSEELINSFKAFLTEKSPSDIVNVETSADNNPIVSSGGV